MNSTPVLDTTPKGRPPIPFEPLQQRGSVISEAAWVRRTLIAVAITFLALFLLQPRLLLLLD